jgi:G6PDH family F420-dependent oxidoreductase
MLEEAVEVIRLLWQGGEVTHRGQHFTVENARIYSLPSPLPPIYVAASGPAAARLAGRIGDGLISTAPDKEIMEAFGGAGKPRIGQLSCCWAASEAEGRRTAFEYWPTGAVRGELSQELPTPKFFEQAVQMLTEEDVAKAMVCGPDPERYLVQIQQYVDAGFDQIYIHQIGPQQEGFMEFCAQQILPRFSQTAWPRAA